MVWRSVLSRSFLLIFVLANPPFGKKSSISFTNEEGEQETEDLTYNRQDFGRRHRTSSSILSSISARC